MTFSSTTIMRGSVHPKADIAVVQAGTKTTAIRRLMEFRPDLLLRYQAVLFLDDDVEIDAAGIDALFRAMTAEKLDLAQPALTADSATAYPFLKRPSAAGGVMRVSSVEIMAPALTRRALECAHWVFAESVSGWGSDLLLGPAVRSGFGPNERRGHRLGRRPARGARRPQRRRLLRLSAPLRRRSRTRGQQGCGRLRRRTLSAAARARAKPEKLAKRRLTERRPDHSEDRRSNNRGYSGARSSDRSSARTLRAVVIGLTRRAFPRS